MSWDSVSATLGALTWALSERRLRPLRTGSLASAGIAKGCSEVVLENVYVGQENWNLEPPATARVKNHGWFDTVRS